MAPYIVNTFLIPNKGLASVRFLFFCNLSDIGLKFKLNDKNYLLQNF
jgi:hypothetical protein